MINRIYQALSYLRRMPLAQRRIAGLATYIVIAAVIFSFEFASWRSTVSLSEEGGAKTPPLVRAEKTKEEKIGKPGAELASPFTALKENAADALRAVRRLAADVRELPNMVSPPPSEAGPPGAELPAATSPPPNAVRPPSAEPPSAILPPTPAENRESKKEGGAGEKPASGPKPPLASRPETAKPQQNPGVASLIANRDLWRDFPSIPLPPPKLPTQNETKTESELVKMLRYNFGQVSQAAADFYRYIRE